ncbi:PR domain zinc finger protein 2 [Gadus chalcogrammus]|uniref:PR domain zinc finger protein 2 n=1 Tax=Gadus chalcogrammus TaxID=1042646 RepID=UPI0024C45666|nr:PR domain zinc finger protein 2 [Gadus chalcogrammus]
MMEDSPCLYISVYEDDVVYEEEEEEEEEEEGEGDMEGSDQEEVTVETDMRQPSSPELCENQDSNSDWDSFPCPHCENCFNSQQGLECHIRNHTLPCHDPDTDEYANSNSPLAADIHPQEPDTHLSGVDSLPSLSKQNNGRHEPPTRRGDDQETEGAHGCDHCEKVFNTRINKRRHEQRFHRRRPPVEQADQTPLLQQEAPDGGAAPDDGPEPAQHHVLDISGDVSENLSLYGDGKVASTSAMSDGGGVEVAASSSAVGGTGSLLLDPAQTNQALSSEVATGQDTAGPSLAKRRTATPPLLPQIKTELGTEVVGTSSSSSLVSSLIENLLPQRLPSSAAHRERTIFLSPKLKRLLDEQDGLKPTLALITDGQKFSAPLSVSVVPAGSMRYRRRTVSPAKPPEPRASSSKVEEKVPEAGDDVSTDTAPTEVSATHALEGKDDATAPAVEEMEASCVAEERWPPRSGGNPCNQLPLDLSNAVKRGEEEALAEAALDLSLQKQSPDALHPVSISVPPLKKKKPNSSLLEQAMLNQYAKAADPGEQNITLGNPEAPLVSNFTIVTGSRPGEPSSESLVYGLTLPPVSLDPSHTSLLPVALQQPSACTIALSSSAVHTMLPTASNLITVLASIANPSNQALQVVAPNMASEPLVICREDSLNLPGCDFNSAFANAAGLLTLSQPFDPALNMPAHVFLTDPIALNAPVVDSVGGSGVAFSPAVTLTDSLLSSYNIPSNTVLIECTIALQSSGNMVPATMNLQETMAEAPAAPQMITNQMMEQQQQQQQQQVVSLPSPQTVDLATVAPPLTESVTVSETSPVAPVSPTLGGSYPEPGPAPSEDEERDLKEGAYVEQAALTVETPHAKTPPPPVEDEEPSDDPPSGTPPPPQTFTKNFVCNVCDKLFHSMKELGHHVGDHAEEWPYKCEFCVLLFDKPSALLEHRLALHGVGTTYVCSVCSKEFVYLSNLKHHQEELHPGRQCSHTQEEKGKLRPQNRNCSTKVDAVTSPAATAEESKKSVKREEGEAGAVGPPVQITASDDGDDNDSEVKGPDVRLGINQHYPSFKPPPFPYHNRSPAGSMASATNFTTHNIPQSFSTAIRCTKCGKSFDNLPELHKHILACANASDKKRYTPKKNPIPLRHFAKAQSGVLSTTNATNGLNASHRPNHRSRQSQDLPVKMKLTALDKRKKRSAHRAVSQRNKPPPASDKAPPPPPPPAGADDAEKDVFACPHCSREFTMRRSRTKHMAVCPKKPKEVKKRKDAAVSLTKENNGQLLRGGGAADPLEERRQPPPAAQKVPGGRVYVSTPAAKRPAILPVQAVLSHKRSTIIIKESVQHQNQDESALSDLPVVRTFNPAMRQYGRAQPGAKDGVKTPLKITLVRPQGEPEEPSAVPGQGGAQTAAASSNHELGTDQQSPAV